MTTALKLGMAAVFVATLTASGGYWYGKQQAIVHKDGSAETNTLAKSASEARNILFYRNPMGLPETTPTPKKDPMRIDYIPVYYGEQQSTLGSANLIRISTDKVQKLCVRVEAASTQALNKTVRAAGRIEPDERQTFTIAPKFEGYVERLYVNATGQPVGKGQPLFDVYSPELVSAQREEAQRGMRELADSSLSRLRNWDISDEQITALTQSTATRRTLTLRSPVSGIVTEKKAVQGMRFMPGEMLYQVTNLASVWVIADVFEQDIGQIRTGAKATVRINAYPDKQFSGAITYVYPTLKSETRTVPVRVELSNPHGLLKPGMFAQVELPVDSKRSVLTVPTSAVIDSGTRQIILVQVQEGRFDPREVKLGARSDDRIEVLEGVRDGEMVVVAANFLIDAESNLKAAIGGLGHSGHGAAASKGGSAESKTTAFVGHRAEGKIEDIDTKSGSLTIAHGPVSTLKWPAMTMEFKVANETLLKNLKPGAKVSVEFVERQPGEWVITSVKP